MALCDGGDVRRGTDPCREGFPETGCLYGPPHGAGESDRIIRTDMYAIDPVSNGFRHSADTTCDDGPPVHERLLDDQRGVFPPDRRHHDPIDGSHKTCKILSAIWPKPHDMSLDILEKAVDIVDEFLRLKWRAAVEAEFEFIESRRDEALARLEKD